MIKKIVIACPQQAGNDECTKVLRLVAVLLLTLSLSLRPLILKLHV